MSTVKPVADPESDPRVKAVFDEIRTLRGSDFVNNFWRYLAFDPVLLADVWHGVRDTMLTPSALDPKVKEMIYIAVSAANACSYCVHSHTAAARARGMTGEEHADLLRVIAMAARTNHLANALQVPLDTVFDADKG